MWGQIVLFLARVAVGGMMLFAHGLPKMLDFSQRAPFFPDPFGVGGKASLSLAIFAEVFCSIALMLGLLTRWASVPLAITMGVAAFYIHAHDPFAKKELALIYLLFYLVFMFNGGGRYAIDFRLRRGRH